MSLFNTLFDDIALPALERQFGETGKVPFYRADGTSAGAFTVMLGPECGEEDDEGVVREYARHITIKRQAGLPFWSRSPGLGWTLKITEGGVDVAYAIDRLLARSQADVTLRIKRLVGARRGQSGVRRK